MIQKNKNLIWRNNYRRKNYEKRNKNFGILVCIMRKMW